MRNTLFILFIIAFIVSGCAKESETGQLREKVVHITASLADYSAVTKAFQPGSTSFNNGDGYGIFVCKEGTSDVAHKSNSWNLAAKYYYDSDSDTWNWGYHYVGDITTGALNMTRFDNIALTERNDHAKADLYAYAPYRIESYSYSPDRIPFNVYTNVSFGEYRYMDLMYAQENLDPELNKGLDPASPSDLSAHFTLKHAFCLLAFRFRVANTPTTYRLDRINISLNDPDGDGETTAKLYTAGTFNAMTGTFNSGGTQVNSILYTNFWNDTITSTSPVTYYELIVPTQVEDDEMVFTFTIDGLNLHSYSLKKSDLLHSDGVTYGFQSGHKYTFNFVLDNYIYFDGFTISDGWTSADLGNEEI